jgi:predicted Fe-S protein YdhL (DUF1289 family)
MAIYSIDADGEAAVESPCIRVCVLDDEDICVGCFRSVGEICAWSSASDAERRLIVDFASARRESKQQHG